MSGDVQARNRRKDKKKPKRDSTQEMFKRLSFSEEDDTAVPGVDTSKFNETDKRASVQMHVPEHDDHSESAGMCAKIVFFALMAILLSLVVLIVIENRGGSDVDTPLSESRFSEYLQGWVDEKREEEHHEPIVSYEEHDDHDDHDDTPEIIPDNEPYPEEKDISNLDDNDDTESQELNAEINVNQSEQENLSKEVDDDESPNSQEENQSEQENDDNNANIFEDSAPFDEEDDNDEIDDFTENVIDNDEGEDLLLQKIAEESEMSQQKIHESSGNDDDENQESSSQIPAEEEGGGAQSYIEELLRQQTLEENY